MDGWNGMSLRVRRVLLLATALGTMAVALVGCQQAPIPGIVNNTTALQIITPNPGQLTPTPTFPPFTVGAWPSNYSPNNKDSITIYVFCRVQPGDMAGPSTPPKNSLQVTVNVLEPVNKQFTGNTDNVGLAAVPITFDDQQSGKPVVVAVSVNYNGTNYNANTFFTPNPTATPTPTPKPGTTPTASPSASPTVTP
jgi:hypothetical protein